MLERGWKDSLSWISQRADHDAVIGSFYGNGRRRVGVSRLGLGEEFCRRMRSLANVIEAVPGGSPVMPCSGLIRDSFTTCHATRESDWPQKNFWCLLAMVSHVAQIAHLRISHLTHRSGSAAWLATHSGTCSRFCLRGQTWINRSQPNCGAKTSLFWHSNPESEVLPGVFQRAGLAPEDYRIFVFLYPSRDHGIG